ncbi:hypothetical protein Tco_0013893 [Tanacetum coccineum]
MLNGGAVTWKSSKQDTVVDSTCESEYITACEDSKEAIWMKNFIGDLGVVSTVQDPIEIFCDNESGVALTKEPKDYGKLMHKIVKRIENEAKTVCQYEVRGVSPRWQSVSTRYDVAVRGGRHVSTRYCSGGGWTNQSMTRGTGVCQSEVL